ncbi:hypothetical protein C8R44DRAFT_785431 [Mycena epipterygia]|nr:hypothetical protein C8R44DRAFT_785431 [Mycena epipterygia]
MLDGVLQGEDTTLRLGLIANIGIFLAHSDHDTLMTGPPYDRWKDGSRSIVPSKTGLAHARTIVKNQGCDFVLHYGLCG